MDARFSSVLSSLNLTSVMVKTQTTCDGTVADSPHQGESSRSMDTCDGSVQDQDSSEENYQVQTNSHNYAQCSDHNYHYPLEMELLKPEVVVDEEQHVGIVKGGLQEQKEDIEEEILMNNESFPPESSCRSTIKHKTLKEFYEKGMREIESDGEYHSPSTMMQIQDIPPNVSTAITVNFNNKKNPVPLNKQDLSPAGIEEQGNFTHKKCVNTSDKSLFTHNGYVKKGKIYECKYCVYTTNKKSNLTNHILTHTGERPYSCQFCDKAFNIKSNLTTHLRTHTGERPYSCKLCDKSFAQKATLKSHLHAHAVKMFHSCEIKHKNLKEVDENMTKEVESDGEYHSPSTVMQIQDIPPNISTANIVNFNNENNPVPLNKQDLSPEGIEEQGNSTHNKCVNTSDKLLLTHNGYVEKRRIHSCKYCDYRTDKKTNFINHTRTHTGERPYSCQLCDKAFTIKSNLTTHLRTHTGERPYSCKLCDKSFAQKAALQSHLHAHAVKMFHSNEIKLKNLKEIYENMTKEVESDGEYHSPSTMMQMQDIPPNVSTAITVNFNNEKNPVPLNKQDLSPAGIEEQGNFTHNRCINTSDKLLFTQNGYVEKRKIYRCKYCVYTTNKKSNFTDHIHTHTGERPYSCQFCDKAFTMKSNLTTHLRTHTGDRPYCCKFCDRSFVRKSDLISHLYTHTDERPYSCNICDKAFTKKSDLTKHSRTHTGERPYSCEICFKTFTQKSYLTTHFHTHTGEKPYICEFCDKKYTDKSNLTKHLRTHTGERPYSCEIKHKNLKEVDEKGMEEVVSDEDIIFLLQ